MVALPKFPSFTGAFFKLSAANILSNLLVPLAGLIDTAFLGHLSDIRYLAGVALATVLFNYLYWTFGFLRMGTTGMTAQVLGSGEDRQGQLLLILVRNGAIALIAGFGILLFQIPLRQLGFALLGGSDAVQQAGIAFFHSRVWDAPATLLNFVLLGWFLGQGQGRRVLILSAIANGANIILDYGFVVRLGWASAGAGAATALSQYLMLGAGLGFLWGELRDQNWPVLRKQLLDWPALKALFQLNRDILIRTFVLVSAFSSFTRLGAGMGTEILAANSLLIQGVGLASYWIDGFAFATETFAGRFWGEGGAQAQLRQLLGLSGGVSVVTGVLFAIAFIQFPSLFQLLTSHTDVLATVAQFSGWLLPVLGIGAIAFTLDGYFLGLTAGRVLRNASLVSVLGFYGPVAIAAGQRQSPTLLWLAMVMLMVGRAATLAWAMPRYSGSRHSSSRHASSRHASSRH